MNIHQLYLRSGLFSLGGKIAASVSALTVLWLMNTIAGKDVFGEIMIAYSLNFILAAALAGQFQTIVLYHTSRTPDVPVVKNKLGAALFYATVTGLALVALERLFIPGIENLMHKPGIGAWFSSMSWIIPAYAINSILCTWYRARQDVPTMVMYFDVWPSVLRMIFLGFILILSLTPQWISMAYILSYLVPFLVLFAQNPVSINANPRHFTRQDMAYSFQMMISQFMSRSLSHIVVFILGIFAPAAAAADFTLAMKFSQFLQLPKLVLTQIQMPRMGEQLENNKNKELLYEFEAVRSLSLATTILGTAFFILLLPYIFQWFGDFRAAMPIFVVLAIGAIIMAGFGSVGNYLGIAGYAGSNLLINAAALAALLAALFVFVPGHGAMGAAIASTIGSLMLMGFMTAAIQKKDSLNFATPSAIIQMILSSALLALAAAGILNGPTAALLLIGVAALGILQARPALRALLPF